MERRFEVPVLVAALLVIPVILVEESEPSGALRDVALVVNWAIWLVFAAELVAVLSVVPRGERLRWLRGHVLETAVVVLTPPFAPASMQAARAFRLLRLVRLCTTANRLRRFFSPAGLRDAAVFAGLVLLAGGAGFAAVEKEQDLSAWDGVYWAMSTMTTVGYGDITPDTDAGRAIALAVMLVGIGVLGLLIGAATDRFVRSDAALEIEPTGPGGSHEVLLAELRAVNARLDQLERRLSG